MNYVIVRNNYKKRRKLARSWEFREVYKTDGDRRETRLAELKKSNVPGLWNPAGSRRLLLLPSVRLSAPQTSQSSSAPYRVRAVTPIFFRVAATVKSSEKGGEGRERRRAIYGGGYQCGIRRKERNIKRPRANV